MCNLAENFAIQKIQETYKRIKSSIDQLRDVTTIYPSETEVLKSFNYIKTLDDIKVVIVGNEPYNTGNISDGLAYSVREGNEATPVLLNIFKELQTDLNLAPPHQVNLDSWAKQGVLLLNRVLTVEEKKPMSHSNMGWQDFTDEVIKYLNRFKSNISFLLWGRESEKVERFILNKNNLILKAAHPAPLSANRGFFGSKPFSKTNEFLISIGKQPIDWRL